MTLVEHDRPPILAVMPPELRTMPSPAQCMCQHCRPGLSDLQRAAHERVMVDWRSTQIAWCDAHGYLFSDLLQAEMRGH
jgi:hypothetical protein